MATNSSTSSTASAWAELQDLVGDTARAQARWAKAALTAARDAGRGDRADPRDVLATAGSEYQDYLRELGRLNLAYVRSVQALTTATGDRMLGLLTDLQPDASPTAAHDRRRTAPSAPSAPSAAPWSASLPLRGPVGGSASATFTVANSREEPARISFAAGPLTDVATPGAAAPPARFTFDPGSVRLAPGDEATVTVMLPIDADGFAAGHTYRGEIAVLGGDGTRLEVTVQALEPTSTTTKKATARKSSTTKSAAKKAAKRPARARRTPPRRA